MKSLLVLLLALSFSSTLLAVSCLDGFTSFIKKNEVLEANKSNSDTSKFLAREQSFSKRFQQAIDKAGRATESTDVKLAKMDPFVLGGFFKENNDLVISLVKILKDRGVDTKIVIESVKIGEKSYKKMMLDVLDVPSSGLESMRLLAKMKNQSQLKAVYIDPIGCYFLHSLGYFSSAVNEVHLSTAIFGGILQRNQLSFIVWHEMRHAAFSNSRNVGRASLYDMKWYAKEGKLLPGTESYARFMSGEELYNFTNQLYWMFKVDPSNLTKENAEKVLKSFLSWSDATIELGEKSVLLGEETFDQLLAVTTASKADAAPQLRFIRVSKDENVLPELVIETGDYFGVVRSDAKLRDLVLRYYQALRINYEKSKINLLDPALENMVADPAQRLQIREFREQLRAVEEAALNQNFSDLLAFTLVGRYVQDNVLELQVMAEDLLKKVEAGASSEEIALDFKTFKQKLFDFMQASREGTRAHKELVE